MTQLFISEREHNDATVLDLSGDVIFGESNTTLRQAIRRLLNEGNRKIFINLRDVGYLDSSGIGELISALTAVSRVEGGQLRILNPTDRILSLFSISKLTDIFDIDFTQDH